MTGKQPEPDLDGDRRPVYRASTNRRSCTEWAVLDTLRAHLYETRTRGSKPDDPGWHPCSCGWEGYWCDYQPHVAEQIVAGITGGSEATPRSPLQASDPSEVER